MLHHPRVGHENINSPEARFRRAHRIGDLPGGPHVALERNALSPQTLDFGGDGIDLRTRPGDYGDIRSLPGKSEGDGAADTAPAPGHQRPPALKPHERLPEFPPFPLKFLRDR